MDQLERASVRRRGVGSVAVAGVVAALAALPMIVWSEALPLGLTLLFVCFAGRGMRD